MQKLKIEPRLETYYEKLIKDGHGNIEAAIAQLNYTIGRLNKKNPELSKGIQQSLAIITPILIHSKAMIIED